jgi:hypothetical protein
MSTSPETSRRWVWVAITVVALLLFLLIAFLRRGDERIQQAVAQLRPGMTVEEMRQVLRPTSAVKMASGSEVSFVFYGVDEFVWVYLDGEGARVTRIEHQPDLGPWYERYRRRWDHRFRP